MDRRTKTNGFTVLELGVVVGVMAVLSSVMIPSAMQSARIAKAQSYAQSILSMVEASRLAYTQNNTWPGASACANVDLNGLVPDFMMALPENPFDSNDVVAGDLIASVTSVGSSTCVLTLELTNIPETYHAVLGGTYGALPMAACSNTSCTFKVLPPGSDVYPPSEGEGEGEGEDGGIAWDGVKGDGGPASEGEGEGEGGGTAWDGTR
jgi:type II secretory pathway pseudopilin PulG